MMRKHIKRCLEWFHIVLILSMLAPVIYMADSQMEPGQIYRIYVAGYLLIVPVIGLLQAEKKCKTFIQYLAIFVCMSFVVELGAQRMSRLVLNERAALVYTVCMIICTVLIAVGAFVTRMYKIRRKEARETQDTTWVEDGFILDKPSKAFSVLFVVIYVIGLFHTCPQICNLALYSTLAYLLVAIAYEYIDSTEEYLKLNEDMYHVQNIPYKRIYGIGKLFIIGYLFLIFLTAIPAFLTAGYREYKEIQVTEFEKVIVPEDIYIQPPMDAISDPLMTEMEVDPIIPREILLVLDVLLYAIGVITVVSVLVAAIFVIRKELAQFEKTADEEEDVVESLEPEKEDEQFFIGKKAWKRTDEDRIRRLYRKFIRKYRKEVPAIYETPTEIEMIAGVADMEEGKAMHEKYEQARYKQKM